MWVLIGLLCFTCFVAGCVAGAWLWDEFDKE